MLLALFLILFFLGPTRPRSTDGDGSSLFRSKLVSSCPSAQSPQINRVWIFVLLSHPESNLILRACKIKKTLDYANR